MLFKDEREAQARAGKWAPRRGGATLPGTLQERDDVDGGDVGGVVVGGHDEDVRAEPGCSQPGVHAVAGSAERGRAQEFDGDKRFCPYHPLVVAGRQGVGVIGVNG